MKEIKFNVDYPLGHIVYYKTDMNNEPGMVVGIMMTLNGSIIYRISFGGDVHHCYEEEIRDTKVFNF